MNSPHTLPTVNLNGTSRQALIDDYRAAWFAVRNAQIKLVAIGFNPRDYQQAPGIWTKARIERTVQIGKLRSVGDYLEAHLDALLDSCN